MAYKQVVQCYIDKMGSKPGYCLQNVRLAFGISPKYYDAKEAMEANRAAGTLHDVSTLPPDISVPIFVDTPSPNEHVIISDKGQFYSDGKKLTTINGLNCFGWGETLNDVRIVEAIKGVPDTPEAIEIEPLFKKGDVVVPTSLVDYDGTVLKQWDPTYTVSQYIPGSDHVVLEARGTIWASMNIKDVKKVS